MSICSPSCFWYFILCLTLLSFFFFSASAYVLRKSVRDATLVVKEAPRFPQALGLQSPGGTPPLAPRGVPPGGVLPSSPVVAPSSQVIPRAASTAILEVVLIDSSPSTSALGELLEADIVGPGESSSGRSSALPPPLHVLTPRSTAVAGVGGSLEVE
jgi:hypothetical protein